MFADACWTIPAQPSFSPRSCSCSRVSCMNKSSNYLFTTFQTVSPAVASSNSSHLIVGAAAGFALVGATTYAQSEALPVYGKAGTNQERTFLAVKPDGVQRGLIGDIIARFEKRGYKLVGLKMVWPTKEMAAEHYGDLKKKPFFPGLVDFFSSGPIVCMCWEVR